ncbi:MAG: ABC transporter ATP-binding protein, partial [Planctomycetota bacterium]
EINDLAVSFDTADGRVQAVDGLSLTIHPRQTLAVVGESGCGKTVTALSVLQLLACPPARVDRGSILWRDRDLLSLRGRELLRVRGGEIAMIFQEPMTSLNPVYTVGDQIVEAVRLHRHVDRKQAEEITLAAMHEVGIAKANRRLGAYPHEFSGGMRQRVMIAMALSCSPKLLLADEPTTALDVTIQAQILELLARIQRERDLAVMLITHDLGIVAESADVVCVMYAGRAVEYATVYDLFERPLHPYTRGLLAAIPRLGEEKDRLRTVEQVVSDPREFAKLRGHERGVVPWWPSMPPPRDMAGSSDGAVLYEVEPRHWVACWATEAVTDQPQRPPDLDFRRSGIEGS